MKGIWRIPRGRWELAKRAVRKRAKGKCENCDLPIESARTKITPTDRPKWTIHHKKSIKELKDRARELCKALSSDAYFRCLRLVFVRLATDPENLELRCHRKNCRAH